MQELSMHLLDIVQNSIRAQATKIDILVDEDIETDNLIIVIKDNGCGMSEEQVSSVIDPFFTTRTTRKVGLGIPLYKMAAEQTGGSLQIESEIGAGTVVKATFGYSHIDRMPLGDMADTIAQIICLNEPIDIAYTHKKNKDSFTATTSDFTSVLEGVPLNTPEVMLFVKDYVEGHILALGAS